MGDEEDKETARSIAKAQGLQFHCIPTERCGALNVYIQGDIEATQKSYNPLGPGTERILMGTQRNKLLYLCPFIMPVQITRNGFGL